MCGIAGIYAPGARPDTADVSRMLASMAHRGPDDRGLQTLAGGHLVFGHLRLSILDLSPLGHQPMATADGRVWIVFNGEIYNFREIREQLVSLGDRFVSDSDTEVILASYQRWGLGAVERFRGMFSFALWDDSQKRLHLCRDRFGVKPLYFAIQNGRMVFASEMKGIVCAEGMTGAVDPMSVAQFIQYGYISAPASIFAGVRTVRPGTICTIDTDMCLSEREYWTTRDLFDGSEAKRLRIEFSRMSDAELLDRTEDSLREAFSYRMVSDVPVGVFLSGGIDSSLVAALLTRRVGYKLKTFTIGFGDSEFDESDYARTVAERLGAEHTEFSVSSRAVIDSVSEVIDIADEPIGDSSLVPTLMVSRLARQHVKVALSADGADELFGGYARYAFCGRFLEKPRLMRGLFHMSAELLDALPPRIVARAYSIARRGGPGFAAINDKLKKFVRMSRAHEEFEAYDAAISEWTAQHARALQSNGALGDSSAKATYQMVRGQNIRDRFMHFDMTRYLPGDLLVKVDRASMAVSLEAREPFLDHEMARIAAALSTNWKVRGSENKYILRQLLYRHFPRALFDRPKQGFSAPIGEWLRGPLRGVLLEELSTSRVEAEGILDARTVEVAVKRFLTQDRRAGSAAGIWILLQLQQWARRWNRCPALVTRAATA